MLYNQGISCYSVENETMCFQMFMGLTHWGQVRHICIGNLTISGSNYGLSPGQHQAIIWTNAGILLIEPLRKIQLNFNWNSYIFFQENAFENVVWKMLVVLSRPQCVNTLGNEEYGQHHPNNIVICIFMIVIDKFLLTLYMLNFSEGTKTYIYILCHFSTLVRRR